jgi:hypothetical protein
MEFGFIILRHVNNVLTNNYWIGCYACIRKFYPDHPIIIIDDNSEYNFVNNIPLNNATIIQSEYKQRGELLPYVYFLKNAWFPKAVILHDSVFIQKHIDFHEINNCSLWHFQSNESSLIKEETHLISKCRNTDELLAEYNKREWQGCFGGMAVVSHDFVSQIETNYGIFSSLIPHIQLRRDRQCLERILGLAFYMMNQRNYSIFGDITKYCKWGYPYKSYVADKKNLRIILPIIKCWTGR